MSPLYHRRNEINEIERQEAEGVSFWTTSFPEATRNRIALIMRGGPGRMDYPVLLEAMNLLLLDLGELSLYPGNSAPEADFFKYLAECSDDQVPSVIEAFGHGYGRLFEQNAQRQAFSEGKVAEVPPSVSDPQYVREINRVLREDRIAFQFINGDMVPFASRELHVEVVQPVLRLLATSGWERVEASYQDALSEIARGSGANAITDAGTALQEALVQLGASGNQIGDLIASAKKRGLIAGHDESLLRVIEKACQWVSADRSVTGDTHNADPASIDDAWFTVHIVGAIIVRLAGAARSHHS